MSDDLNKDIGKLAGRVSVLEAGSGTVAETLVKIDNRLAQIEQHSAKVCALADLARFILRVVIPALAGVGGIFMALNHFGLL